MIYGNIRIMVIAMMPDRRIWDEEYIRRGTMWAGSTTGLPVLPAGSRVLELGCGSGKTLGPLILQGLNVTAIDLSASALSMCRGREHGDPHTTLAVADATSLPFRSGSFDAVYAVHVMGHLKAPGRIACAAEIARVLEESGILIFRAFSTSDFRCGNGVEVEPGTFRRGTGVFTHYFCEEEIGALFPALACRGISRRSWTMRVRGIHHPRSEITAVFEKALP